MKTKSTFATDITGIKTIRDAQKTFPKYIPKKHSQKTFPKYIPQNTFPKISPVKTCE
jgi:hypothetical protein